MLRLIVVLLVLANLGFLAWSRGWLSPWLLAHLPGEQAQREPHRLQAQMRPESIQLVNAADARRLATSVCLQAGPFGEAALAAAESAWQRTGQADLAIMRFVGERGTWLRLPQVDSEQQAAVQGLNDAALAGGFTPCP